jgi:hypothetical protein
VKYGYRFAAPVFGFMLIAGSIMTASAVASAHPSARVLHSAQHRAASDGLSIALARRPISKATYALLRAESLFHPRQVAARIGASVSTDPREATLILRDLVAHYKGLSPAQKTRADQILARPTDGGADPAGDGYAVAEHSPADCDADVCIHWVDSTSDAPAAADGNTNGIPDYVDSALSVAANVWTAEVGHMGYRAPLGDTSSSNDGGDGKLDIYLADLGNQDLYGYCTTDDPNAFDPNYQFGNVSAYCVVDNDYSPAQFQTGASGLAALEVTTAHEFFHAVQFAYDAFDDSWFMEGTATWMEDEVYNAINDNRQYFSTSPLRQYWLPLDTAAKASPGYRGWWYGSWVWFRYLSERFGAGQTDDPALIRSMWQRAGDAPGDPDQYSIQAVKSAVKAEHGTGAVFREVFGTFKAWNRNPAKHYREGAAYPGSGTIKTFTMKRKKPSTGWWRLTLDHLAGGVITFVPGQSIRQPTHLTIKIEGPELRFAPDVVVIVNNRNGVSLHNVGLSADGIGDIRLGFRHGSQKRIDLILANASTRFICWEGGLLSCQGHPRDNGKQFFFKAAVH